MSNLISSDFLCTICLKLLYKPSTTNCGHTFCQRCLSQALNHKPKCPICRSVLHSSPSRLAVNTDFARLLESAFEKEYELRKVEDQFASYSLAKPSSVRFSPSAQTLHLLDTPTENQIRAESLPVMIICPILPQQRLHLHIFEPRYRTMVNQCLQGSRCFGMMPRTFERWYLYGTEVEIVECEALPAGRFYLEVVGKRIFKVASTSATTSAVQHAGFFTEIGDGEAEYLRCNVEYIDINNHENEQEGDSERIYRLSRDLEPLVSEWQNLVYENRLERSGDHLRRIARDLGPMPHYSQAGSRALWVAALINPLPSLSVAQEIRPQILSAPTVLRRLEIVTEAINKSIEYMKPNKLTLVLLRSLKRANSLLHFLFRHSWLLILAWWLAQRYPGVVSREAVLNLLKMMPPN